MRRLTILVLALAVGCAGMNLPKTITQGDVTPLRKKRREEVTREFDRQRDFAQHEAAKDSESADFAGPPTKPDNPQIPISAAADALRANQPDQALELLTPAAKQFPSSAAIHRMLGVAYYRAGDYQSSQLALQQALSLDKSSALSYLLMGCTLAKLGQNEAAEAHFRQARTLDPRYKIVR